MYVFKTTINYVKCVDFLSTIIICKFKDLNKWVVRSRNIIKYHICMKIVNGFYFPDKTDIDSIRSFD